MKVTTEKLPKSLLALQIELDKDQLERGLDKAARRLSQRYPVQGFRPGKAPRIIIERTYGRAALIEEASEDLINKAYRDALAQENINPVGQPSLEGISSADPFVFKVTVPVAPTVNVGDYRAIQLDLESAEVTDEQVERGMDVLRDKHVVLKEIEEPRPAQDGDQLKLHLVEIVDGQPLDGTEDDDFENEDDDDDDDDEDDDEDEDEDEDDDEDDDDEDDDDEDDDEGDEGENNPRVRTLDLVKGRLVDELYEGLVGMRVGEKRSIDAQMPEDHPNEQVRGKTVTFKVKVLGMQERLLPDWEELPTLENFEGDLEALRAKTRTELEETAKTNAERKLVDAYIDRLVEQTEFDIPDVIVRDLAHDLLHEQGAQYERYGITLDQMLQYRGKTHDEAVEELMPEAEKRTKVTLALREVSRGEDLQITEDELATETERLLGEYPEEQRANVAQMLQTQLRNNVANIVLDRKLRERLVAIATGTAPAPARAEAAAPAEATAPAEAAPSTAGDTPSTAGDEVAPPAGTDEEA